MDELVDQLLLAEDMKGLESHVATFRDAAEQTKLLSAGVTKSAQNVSSHVANQKRKAERETQKRKREQEQRELEAVKMRARQAARKVKSESQTVQPIFLVGLDKLQSENVGEPFGDAVVDGSEPAILVAVRDAAQQWNREAKIQVREDAWTTHTPCFSLKFLVFFHKSMVLSHSYERGAS